MAEAQQQQEQEQQQQGFDWSGFLWKAVIMYWVFQVLQSRSPRPEAAGGKVVATQPRTAHSPLWKTDVPMQLHVYLHEHEAFTNFSDATLVWHSPSIKYSSDHETVTEEMEYPVTPHLRRNGTLFLHAFFTRPGYTPDPHDDDGSVRYHRYATFHDSVSLFRYHREPIMRTTKNLITGKEEKVLNKKATAVNGSLVGWWKPELTISLLHDSTVYPRGGIPSPMDQKFRFDDEGTRYFPPLYFDEFWLMKEHLIMINDSITVLPLKLHYAPISMMKFQMQLQMQMQWAQQEALGVYQSGQTDEFKRILTDTNPYLLGATAVVSVLHMIFDCLAFKNDIQFWRNNKSMVGLSAKKIATDCVVSLIIFLYLLDNDTSWMILCSSGIGTFIEFWKIKKAVHFEMDWSNTYRVYGMPIRCPVVFHHRESYENSGTREYDDMAMRYISFVLFPLIVGYASYSLVHISHKSWYSWLLSSLTGAVYTFGFVMMTPQLFINYKLKSVAHLPWRTMCYKSLNTFIDDLFAFIITMPTMHRLACFRDDIIFFIYIYQRWIYRVDCRRKSENTDELEEEAPQPAAVEAAVTAQ